MIENVMKFKKNFFFTNLELLSVTLSNSYVTVY